MAKKRYSYKFWRRSGTRRWRKWSKYNYGNVKVDIAFHVQYPSSNGSPVIYFTTGSGNSASYFNLSTMMNDHSDWSNFKNLYQYWKLRGIKFEATPMSCNAGNENITQSSGIYLGYKMITESETTTSWLQYTDKSFVLNPLQKTSRYFNNFGGQDDWKLTSSVLTGVVACYSGETSTLNTGPVWHVRMTLYIGVKLGLK